MSKSTIQYRYVDVDGQTVAYVTHPDGVGVIRGQDQLSGKPIVWGSAFRTTGRTGRIRRTLLSSGSEFWTERRWLTNEEAVAAIVRRGGATK